MKIEKQNETNASSLLILFDNEDLPLYYITPKYEILVTIILKTVENSKHFVIVISKKI